MIHNIARHCTKTFALLNQSKPHNTTTFQTLTTSPLHFITSYKFSTQTSSKPKRQIQRDAFSPIDYYRNTIRRVNIKANGKGTFSAYNLQKIVNMSSTQQHAKVIFEAYYNYMGHFTVIPNKVVDSLVIKAIQIGNQTQHVLEIFSHHDYLTYFPHYDATNKFIKSLASAKDQQNLEKMLKVIIRSPLMKINTKIVDTLLGIASAEDCEPSTREYVLKVLLFRRNLVDGINKEDLLAKVTGVLQTSEFGPFETKPMVIQSLRELLSQPSNSTEETVNKLILTSTFGLIDDCGSILAKETQQIGSQYDRFFDYVTKLYPRSSQQVNYGTVLKESLVEAKLSLEVSQKLEQLVNYVSE